MSKIIHIIFPFALLSLFVVSESFSQMLLTERQEIFFVNCTDDSVVVDAAESEGQLRWERSESGIFSITSQYAEGNSFAAAPDDDKSEGWDFVDDPNNGTVDGGILAYSKYKIKIGEDSIYIDFRDSRYYHGYSPSGGLDWYLFYYGDGLWKYNIEGLGSTKFTVTSNTLGIWQIFDGLGSPPSVGVFGLSYSSIATSSNNGRRMIRDSDGRYHLVIESDGDITYRCSNVGGTSWDSSEGLTSNGDNKYPSIVGTSSKKFVVWQRYTGYSSGYYNYDTYFAKNTGSGWSNTTISNLSGLTFSSATDPLPVISYHSTPRLVVCVRTSDGIKYCTTDNEGTTWSSASTLPSSGSGDKNASLSDSTTIPCTTIYAAYDDGSAVYYNTYNGSWGSEVNVSSGSGTTNNGYPSAAVDGSGGRLFAWQGYSTILEMNVIVHKRNSEAFVTFAYSGDGGNYPSITGLAGSHRAIVCTSDGATDLNRSVYDGSSWDNQNSIESNVYWPSLSAGTTYAKYVFAKGTEPYEISVYSSSLSKENLQENHFHRAVAFQSSDTKSLLWLELGAIELVGSMMENTHISPIDLKNQDISAAADASVLRYMDSESFTIPRTADSLKWFERIYCSGGQNLFISSAKAMTATLKLVDQENNTSLCVLGSWPVALESGEQRINGCFTKSVSAFRGKVVKIITEMAELPVVQKKVSAGVVDLYLGDIKSPIHKGAENQEDRIPFQFDISIAYPNPFNSITLFRYRLPEQAEVVMEVYNSLGQKIRTLVKELMSGGQHEARWDGHNDSGMIVSSGIYLCRFQCGEYIKTQKVVLLQ